MHPGKGLELERWLGLREFHERTSKGVEEGPSEGEQMHHTRKRMARGKGSEEFLQGSQPCGGSALCEGGRGKKA